MKLIFRSEQAQPPKYEVQMEIEMDYLPDILQAMRDFLVASGFGLDGQELTLTAIEEKEESNEISW